MKVGAMLKYAVVIFLCFLSMAATPCRARETLSTDRTYYVRLDGSDSNDGLTDSAAGAFRHLQNAWNAAVKLDAFNFAVTIQQRSCSDCGALSAVVPIFGAASVNIVCDTVTPANCPIAITDGPAMTFSGVKAYVAGFKLSTVYSSIRASNLLVVGGSSISLGNMDFSDSAEDQIFVDGSRLVHSAPYTISGGAYHSHHHYINFSVVGADGTAVTLRNHPYFGGHYSANASSIGTYSNASFSYPDGAATGSRFYVHYMGTIRLSGVTLPGDVAGTYTGGNLDDNIAASNVTAENCVFVNPDEVPSHGAQFCLDGSQQMRISPVTGKSIVVQGFISVP